MLPLYRLRNRIAFGLCRFSGERAVQDVDVLVVGAGPAGLSAAIRIKQLRSDLNVVVLEKASQLGGHSVSGAVIEPRALDELLPHWRENVPTDKCPLLDNPVTKDKMRLLTRRFAFPLPMPPELHNAGNYIGSLSEFVRWLGRQAEAVGVEIYPGFSGRELVCEEGAGIVLGVATNDLGLDRQGRPKKTYERGMELRAKVTLLAEGCHGSLSKEAIKRFDLRAGRSFQTYGLGLKEVWEVEPARHQPGLVMHGVGWPLDSSTYGGAFMYHFGKGLVSVGLVVGLDYSNPHLSPYREFQKMKLHPTFRNVLQNGKCIAYGARALNEGGWQSIPQLEFPGGALIGCAAGFVNVPKIKGTHTAMKSGALAAEHLVDNWIRPGEKVMDGYETRLRASWIGDELRAVRNVRPAFHIGGLWGGLAYSGMECFLLKGKEPWTLSHGSQPDHATLKPTKDAPPAPSYPKPDGVLTFELLESVSRTGTNHEEDQPCHLQLVKPAAEAQLVHNLPLFGGPEAKFCPAGVYEYVQDSVDSSGVVQEGRDGVNTDAKTVKFQINAQNCIHCKTCDIKDPSQNINWVTPEGGGGPQYTIT